MFSTFIVCASALILVEFAAFAASALSKIAQRLYLFHQDYRKVNDLDAREEMEDHLI